MNEENEQLDKLEKREISNCESERFEKLYTSFNDLMQRFIMQCSVARKYTFQEMSKVIDDMERNEKKIKTYFDEQVAKTGDEEGGEITVEQIQILNPMIEEQKEIDMKFEYLPSNLIVSIASNYDLFLSKLLKKVILDKNMVGVVGKELKLSEVVKYNTKEELISTCVDDVIDDLMRKSHKEQIQWIENKFKIDIINSFNDWKSVYLFFEIRNLVVHNDGVISRIFLGDLRNEGIAVEKYEIGKKIIFDIGNIKKLIKSLIDFSVYTFSLLLRKLYPTEKYSEMIDSIINTIVYNFLCKKEYLQAISIVEYILRNNQEHTSGYKFTLTINKCIALKERRQDSYKRILEALDWSNCENQYKMAKSVLLDDYQNACRIMETLDKEEMLQAYIEWPLFKHFVKSQEFKEKFKEVYGIEFESKMAAISEEKAKYLSDKNILDVEIESEVAQASLGKSKVEGALVGNNDVENKAS